MVIFYALMSAFSYGAADFLGGFSSRKNSVTTTLIWTQAAGLVTILITAPLLGKATVQTSDLLWGMAAGLSGASGVLFLFKGLATGIVSIVSPVAALFGAIIPVIFGLIIGERPPLLTWIGVVLSIPAILLLSRERKEEGAHIIKSIQYGIISGSFFGGFFILISLTSKESGLWPLAAARAITVPLFLIISLIRGTRLKIEAGTKRATLFSGILDMGANIFYLLAFRTGYMIIAVILTALYPAPTVMLQRIFLHEKLTPTRIAGLIISLAGAIFIGIGG